MNHLRNKDRCLPLLACLLLPFLATLCPAQEAPDQKTSAPLVDDLDDLKKIEAQLVSVSDHISAATVCLMTAGGGPSGSGVLVNSSGLILTAAHVLAALGEEAVVVFPDGKRAKAKALGSDMDRDAAMMQITDNGEYPFVNIGPPEPLQVGAWCIATGHPSHFDLLRPPPIRLGRVLYNAKFILTNCTVISGDSGGPLFDMEGRVIGIHGNIGMAYDDSRHVPIKVFLDQWDRLLAAKGADDKNEIKPGGEQARPRAGGAIPPAEEDLDAFLDRSYREAKDGKAQLALTPELIEKFGGIARIQERIAARIEKNQRANEAPKADESSKPPPPKTEEELVALIQKLRKQIKASGDQFFVHPDDVKAFGGQQKFMERLKSTPDSPDETLLSAIKAVAALTRKVSLSTASILADDKEVALGTVVSSDGDILTKNTETEHGNISVRIGEDVFPATLVKRFPEWDLALFNVKASGLNPIKFATEESSAPARGALVTLPDPAGEPLGVGVVGVTARRLSHIGFAGIEADRVASAPGRLLVSSTVENGPAAKAGIKASDVITMVNGQPITDPVRFTRLVAAMKTGETVKLQIDRDGQELTLDLELGDYPLEIPHDKFFEVNRLSCPLSPKIDGFPIALQHDIPLKPSQCGGPLLDMEGRCIGINVSRAGRVNTFTIPASSVAGLLESSRPGIHAAGTSQESQS